MTRHATDLSSYGSWDQFDLRNLFLFILGCGVYFALIVALWEMFETSLIDPYGPSPPLNSLMNILTIPAAWVVLWFLYRKWGLRHALIIHYSGPVLFIGCVLLMGFVAAGASFAAALVSATESGLSQTDVRNFLRIVAIAGFWGCILGSLVSFPAAILMLLYLAAESRRLRRLQSERRFV